MGTTSNLHVWNPQEERFFLRGAPRDKNGILSVVGKDEIITHRFVLFIPKIALYR